MRLFTVLCLLLSTPMLFAQEESTLSAEELNTLSYNALDSLIDLFSVEGDYENLLLFSKKGLAKAKAEQGAESVAAAGYLENLGISYEMLGEYDLAFEQYKKYQKISAKLYGKEHYKYAKSLSNLGVYYWTVGNYQKSEALYIEAERIHRNDKGVEDEGYMDIQNNLALLYHSMGKYEEAELLYFNIIAYDKKTYGEKDANYAYSLNNLASLYWVLGQYAKAEPLFLEARGIWGLSLGIEHPQYAVVTNNLANLYSKMEDYEKAEKLYEQLVKIDKATLGIKHPSYALSMSNLGVCSMNLGKLDKAEQANKEVLDIYIKKYGENNAKLALQYNFFGNLYLKKQNLEQAKTSFRQVLEKVEEAPSNVLVTALLGFSKAYYIENKMDTALVYALAGFFYTLKEEHKAAWSVFPTQASDFELNEALFQFCNNLKEADWDQLLKAQKSSITTSDDGFAMLLDVLDKKYEQLFGLGKKGVAKRYLLNSLKVTKIATNHNKNVLKDLSEGADKLRVVRSNMRFVKRGIRMATKLASESALQEAFSFAEQNKSILLAEAFKGEKARLLGDLPDSIAQKEAAFKAQKDQLKKLKYEATSDEEMAELRSQENTLDLEMNNLVHYIETNFPKYHALKYQNLITTAAEIQEALDDKSMMLEYFIADSLTYLVAITKEKIEVLPIKIHKAFLGNKIKALRLALTNYKMIIKDKEKAYQNYTKTAYWFYQNMLEPILKNDAIEHLVIVADGELGHVPFEAFLVDYSQDVTSYQDLHYLVNDYNISYSYSATLWHENLKSPKKENNHKLLACASAYEPVDSNLLDSRSVYEFKIRKGLSPLPAAVNEVESLKQSFEGLFLKGDSTNEAYFKAHAGDYGVIHLAMHGILHPRVPVLSSLAFTENGDSVENNFLQAYEISHLKLNADLVVLSACETGFGEFEQGEGVMSLARSFMYAGTPSLVVSLWQVNDQCTSLIMDAFYKNLSDGMAIDRALRQAKLDFIQHVEGAAAHPAFWSPFIQLGDARPIYIATKGGSRSWYIGGAFALLFLLIGGFLLRKKG